MNQTERVVEYLRANPGASSLDIVRDLLILNTTGRISDARAAGHVIVCERDAKGVQRYHLVEEPEQLSLGVA